MIPKTRVAREEVEAMLKQALNRYAGLVDPQLDSNILKEIDSLTKVEIILQLEEDFGVNVPEDEVDKWGVNEVVEFFAREGQ